VAVPYVLIALITSAILGMTFRGAPPVASDPLAVAMVVLVYHLPATVIPLFFPGALILILVMYVAAFAVKVLNYTIQGRNDIPAWPDLTAMGSQVMRPFLQIVGTALACAIPALVYYSAANARYPVEHPVLVLLALAGLLYFPMAALTVVMSGSLLALNPVTVVRSICRVPLEYVVLVGFMLTLFLTAWCAQYFLARIPLLGQVLQIIATLYLVLVEMRILGLFYVATEDKLAWFGHHAADTVEIDDPEEGEEDTLCSEAELDLPDSEADLPELDLDLPDLDRAPPDKEERPQ
jgi:hypothetical protein